MRFLIFLLLINITLNASFVRWHGDYESAHREALKENKHLLVLLVDKDTQSAKELIQKTFMNQEYIEVINREFIAVLVTKGQNASYPIELLYTLEYPTLFFLDRYELYSCEPIERVITPNILNTHLNSCY